MGVLDGQSVNAAVTDAAFISKNQDDAMPNKLDFTNADVASGTQLTNIQRNTNSLASFLGALVNQVYNYLPSWATNNLGVNTNSVFQRVEAVDAAFNSTTGHKHDGTMGSGGPISASSLSGTIPVSSGGTGDTTLTAHGVLVGNGTAPVTPLSVGSTGTLLRGQTGADPVFGAAVLTTDVTGILPVPNGGTALSTITSGSVIVGNGTGTPTLVAPATTGNVLTSNGSTWISQAPGGASTNQAIYSRIVGSASQVTAGLATDSTIAAAISAATAGTTIYILPNTTHTETITIAKQLGIVAGGYGCYLSGTWAFQAGSSYCSIKGLRISGNMTIDSGVTGIMAKEIWFDGTSTFVDNSGNTIANILEGIQG